MKLSNCAVTPGLLIERIVYTDKVRLWTSPRTLDNL